MVLLLRIRVLLAAVGLTAALTMASCLGEDVRGGIRLRLEVSTDRTGPAAAEIVRRTAKVIERRMKAVGVRKAAVTVEDGNRIAVTAPGVKNPARLKALVTTTGRLEFKLVDESQSAAAALSQDPPAGREIAYEFRKDPETGQTTREPFLLEKMPLMTGEGISDARVGIDDHTNMTYVSIEFDQAGAKRFEAVTDANVRRRLAIVLDGRVLTAPIIQERISGGQARITGRFTAGEAENLATILRAGALPAPVVILEETPIDGLADH